MFDSKTMRVVKAVRRPVFPITPARRDDFGDLVEMLPGMKFPEIVELVESGLASVADVIRAERVGKARKTVLALVRSDSGKVYPRFS